ncbi:exodeoxyribonuclease V subunit alpha [Methylomagnum ishizawai]|uniref:exodeoxyribonuclease V subunit alpha n=1 Tax=Methylomagnum ishizawai TaxID=1760988 RepID=UPI001C321210|nr:exodeoxyribonuclease V subunit alpha [Methylomagnum ishizawai]BBL75564.1 RecBCD enzyme subunit RecD [Methylomagnum ishizawai]
MSAETPATKPAVPPPVPEVSPLGRQFAAYLCRLGGEDDPAVAWAVRLACLAVAGGQVCLRLADYAGTTILPEDGTDPVELPALAEWQARLGRSRLVGPPGQFAPLILDTGSRLYLARYWNYERKLAVRLLDLAESPAEGIDLPRLRADLDRLFAHNREIPDRQKLAAAVAVLRRFCVISGGPGTGKTSTVVRILAALQAQAGARPLRIALAAPTGKAAARVQEAIRNQKQRLDCPDALRAAIPDTACTLHRLLGARPDSVYFRHHRDNPLPIDVAVVDEASMIDLALMAKLVDALPEHARLILLGDKDQLAAVEAGSVFGDLCASQGYGLDFVARLREASGVPVASSDMFPPALSNCVALLTHSHRFREDSGIGALARLVNEGRPKPVLDLLNKGGHADLVFVRERGKQVQDLAERMAQGYAAYFAAVDAEAGPRETLRAFDRFRVLTAHREGGRGARGVNRQFEERLWAQRRLWPGTRWYAGRPVIVTRNDYDLRLFNGDIGVALFLEGELRVYFEDADGRVRGFAPGRLPEHETVYAMTVHKSQGSEFDEVLLLLPEAASPVLDRPLVYTAITRARHKAEIRGLPAVLDGAIKSPPRPSSGLGERLWHSGQ